MEILASRTRCAPRTAPSSNPGKAWCTTASNNGRNALLPERFARLPFQLDSPASTSILTANGSCSAAFKRRTLSLGVSFHHSPLAQCTGGTDVDAGLGGGRIADALAGADHRRPCLQRPSIAGAIAAVTLAHDRPEPSPIARADVRGDGRRVCRARRIEFLGNPGPGTQRPVDVERPSLSLLRTFAAAFVALSRPPERGRFDLSSHRRYLLDPD